jgi:hypothetical protein
LRGCQHLHSPQGNNEEDTSKAFCETSNDLAMHSILEGLFA